MKTAIVLKILAALPYFMRPISLPECVSVQCRGAQGEWAVLVDEAGRHSTVYVVCDDVPDRFQCGWSRRP